MSYNDQGGRVTQPTHNNLLISFNKPYYDWTHIHPSLDIHHSFCIYHTCICTFMDYDAYHSRYGNRDSASYCEAPDYSIIQSTYESENNCTLNLSKSNSSYW